jgi:hypothetical protein
VFGVLDSRVGIPVGVRVVLGTAREMGYRIAGMNGTNLDSEWAEWLLGIAELLEELGR